MNTEANVSTPDMVRKYICVAPGIYQKAFLTQQQNEALKKAGDDETKRDEILAQAELTESFHHRPGGKEDRNFHKLEARTLGQAIKAKVVFDAAALAFKGKYGPDPDKEEVVFTGKIIDAFEKANCPTIHGDARKDVQLKVAKYRLGHLRTHFGEMPWDKITSLDCGDFANIRKGQCKGGHGGREIDLELTLLSAMFRWAMTKGRVKAGGFGVTSNPVRERTKHRAKTVKHCKQFMPKSGKELHTLVVSLFEERPSEALGWQALLEAMTGCRTSEILRLRWDAKDETEPGYIAKAKTTDGREIEVLYLARSKRGVRPWAIIHPGLRAVLDALRQWRNWRYPESPWFIPGYKTKGGQDIRGQNPMNNTSLTHALARVSKMLAVGHRTSHGLRAFYVTVRRKDRIPDLEIAWEIGDASGADLIIRTYGEIPPIIGDEICWMVDQPAWTVLGMPENVTALPAVAAAG
jgi:integrase